ncbi:MAG TPA: glycosyltransferase family 39 protein [Thermomicrobiales bacterium]|nr:glycosyltransferase family 39 protein [Thermomicrobiales bacterium]
MDTTLRDPDERATWHVKTIERARRLWGSRSQGARTTLMLLPVVVVAALLRLPGLLPGPPGLGHKEATVALASQQIERGLFPIYFRDGNETLEPAFVYLVNLTGQLAGWGITGPRLAAALVGIVAAIGCALWYRQTLGPGWGLAGGLIVATSFWQVAFSQQAVPAIAMAAAGAFGLWALYRAMDPERTQRPPLPSGWFGLAGLAFGIGIYTDVTMRAVVPVVILIGVFLLLRNGPRNRTADRRGLLLGFIVMLLVAAPLASWFWQHPDSFRLGFENLNDGEDIVERITSTLDTLVWSGDGNPAHTMPGRAVLEPILALWGILGVGVALRRPLDPVHAGALVWLAGFLVSIVVIAPGNQAQMLALTPVIFFFPLLGMRAIVRAARGRTIAVALVALSVTVSAAWSIYDYAWNWTDDPDTYQAFSGDVYDAVQAVNRLPNDTLPIYFSTGEHGRIVRYLSPDRLRRDFENPNVLPLPAEEAAYVVAPDSADLHASLTTYLSEEALVAAGTGPDGDPAYRMWFVDSRTRDRLPYAAPVIHFDGGPDLLGFEVSPLLDSDEPAINVVLVYRVATGAERFQSLARLVRLADAPNPGSGPMVQPAPDHLLDGGEIILSRIPLSFPDIPDMIANLHTAVQTPDGEYLIPYGPSVIVVDEYFALLNAIGYIGPEP